MTMKLLLLLIGLTGALGVLYDRLTLNNKKSTHILFLIGLWDKIDSWNIKDYPKLAIRSVLRCLNFPFTDSRTFWRTVILGSVISVILTFAAYNLGYYLHSTPEFQAKISARHPVFFIINLLFDGLTVLATILLFSKAESKPNSWLPFFISLNLIFAILFSVLCLASSTYASQTIIDRHHSTNLTFLPSRTLTAPPGVPKTEIVYSKLSPLQHLNIAYTTFVELVTTRKPPPIRNVLEYKIKKGHTVFGAKLKEDTLFKLDSMFSLPMLLFSTTTLIPTTLWVIIVSLLWIAKASLLSFKWAICHILEKQTESPASYSPGKLTATFIIVVMFLIKICIELY